MQPSEVRVPDGSIQWYVLYTLGRKSAEGLVRFAEGPIRQSCCSEGGCSSYKVEFANLLLSSKTILADTGKTLAVR